MIVSGTRNAVLHEVQAVSIHGTILYDIVYTHEGETQPRRVRLGAESLYDNPGPGDAIRVSYMMNVATTIERQS